MIKTYLLKPENSSVKSFYGKAIVTVYSDGTADLKSYETTVCRISATGEFIRFWNGYSATTARHINEFRMQHGLTALTKKEWLEIPVTEQNMVTELIRLQSEYNRLTA